MSDHNPRGLADFIRAGQPIGSGMSDKMRREEKTGGVIEEEVAVTHLPEKYHEWEIYSRTHQAKFPISQIEELTIEKYRDKNGHIRHLMRGFVEGRKVNRFISVQDFDDISSQNEDNKTGGAVNEVAEGVKTAVEFAVQLMDKISKEDIRKDAIRNFLEMTGWKEEELPPNFLDTWTLADVKAYVRDAYNAMNNEEAMRQIQETHEQNRKKKGYVGMSDEVAASDPNFAVKIASGEYGLRNSGVDVFQVDKLSLKKKVNKAKKYLEKLGFKAMDKVTEEKEKDKDKPTVKETAPVEEAPKKPARLIDTLKDKVDIAQSSSTSRYPAGSSEKLTEKPQGAVDMRPKFGQGIRMVRFR